MKEQGYYWVKPKHNAPWKIARYYSQSEDWCIIGDDESFHDKDWEEIGPMIKEFKK